MKRFSYQAKQSATGEVVKAIVSAESEKAAAKVLLAQGLRPIRIEEQERSVFTARLFNRVSMKDRAIFARQLATLIEASIPIAEALRTVAEQTQNKRLREIGYDVVESVEGGKNLHDSFAKHRSVFSPLFLALVAAGEASGSLDQALLRVADQQEKDGETIGRIRSALTYPAIVFAVIMIVMLFMLAIVVPQVEKIYQDLHKPLPLMTQVMVAGSQVVVQFWWVGLLMCGVLGYGLYKYIHTPRGRLVVDRLKLHAPIFGGMFQRLYVARFTRTGQTLLSADVAMLDMLAIASQSIDNKIVEHTIEYTIEQVQSGKALSTALRGQEGIPDLLPQMISVGEKSGHIDMMLGKSAKLYEDELSDTIRTLSTAIEPVLMVILALFAGTMIAAVLLPIYSLAGNIQV